MLNQNADTGTAFVSKEELFVQPPLHSYLQMAPSIYHCTWLESYSISGDQGPKDLQCVMRFETPHIPAGMVVDDAFSHTLRLVNLVMLEANGNILPENIKPRILEAMAIIHDVPELGSQKDANAIERSQSSELQKTVWQRELHTAQQLMDAKRITPLNFYLFQNFLMAEMYFEHSVNDLAPYDYYDFLQEAFIIRLLDHIEGNMFFHKSYIEWLQSGKTGELEHPSVEVIEFTANKAIAMLRIIDKSETIKAENKTFMTNLIVRQLTSISDMWGAAGIDEQVSLSMFRELVKIRILAADPKNAIRDFY